MASSEVHPTIQKIIAGVTPPFDGEMEFLETAVSAGLATEREIGRYEVLRFLATGRSAAELYDWALDEEYDKVNDRFCKKCDDSEIAKGSLLYDLLLTELEEVLSAMGGINVDDPATAVDFMYQVIGGLRVMEQHFGLTDEAAMLRLLAPKKKRANARMRKIDTGQRHEKNEKLSVLAAAGIPPEKTGERQDLESLVRNGRADQVKGGRYEVLCLLAGGLPPEKLWMWAFEERWNFSEFYEDKILSGEIARGSQAAEFFKEADKTIEKILRSADEDDTPFSVYNKLSRAIWYLQQARRELPTMVRE